MPSNSEIKCLAVTSAFEGAGWGGVDDAGDRMGWSAFALQWNAGQGTLQPLLRDMYAAGRQTFAKCCTQPVDQYGGKLTDLSCALLTMANMGNDQAVAWCNARRGTGGQPLAHWRAAFKALGAEPGFRAIQLQHARPYMNRARAYMVSFEFRSERALALMFDHCVQCGSLSDGTFTRYNANITAGMTERQKLAVLAEAMGPQGGEYAGDVWSRRRTIAHGTGEVHEGQFNLAGAPYFLTDDAAG